jgi:hypothetical protein
LALRFVFGLMLLILIFMNSFILVLSLIPS